MFPFKFCTIDDEVGLTEILERFRHLIPSMRTSSPLPRLATALRHLSSWEVYLSLATRHQQTLAETQLPHLLVQVESLLHPVHSVHPVLARETVLALLAPLIALLARASARALAPATVRNLGLGPGLVQAVRQLVRVSPAP